MKKTFLFLSILLISIFAYSQSTTSVFNVPDSITQFKTTLSSGQIVFDKQSNNLWSLTAKAINTQSLATSVKKNLGGSAIKDTIDKNALFKTDTILSLYGWQQKGNVIDYQWSKIASDGAGHLVAISQENDRVMYSLNNGETWVSYELKHFSNDCGGYVYLFDIVYGNGKFVISGGCGGFFYSTNNGASFTYSETPSNQDYKFYGHPAVAYGKGKFVSVAQGGPTGGLCHYSTDGINWTLGNLDPNSTNSWYDIAFDEKQGYFYAIAPGNNGEFSKSSDGITWTTPVQCAFPGAQKITARDGHIYIMSQGGTDFTYSDNAGVTWNQSTLSTSFGWSTLVYGSGKLFVVAQGAPNNYHLSEISLKNHSTVTPIVLSDDMNFHDLIYVNNEFIAISGTNFDHPRTKVLATYAILAEPLINKTTIKTELTRVSTLTDSLKIELTKTNIKTELTRVSTLTDSLKIELTKTNIIVSGEPVIFKEVGSINNCVVTVYMGLAPKNMMSVKYLITRNGNTAYGTLYFIRSLTGAFIVKDQDRVTEGYEGNVDYGSISFHQVPTYDTGTIMYLEVTINNTSYNANIKFYDYKKL